jgi:type I restriction enzyme S subunit
VEVREQMSGEYPYYGPTGILDWLEDYRAEGDFALIGEDGDHFMEPAKKSQTVKVSGKFNVNNHAHLVGAGSTCSVDWFFHFFRHRDISHSLTRQGAGRFKLTKAALEKLPILLPPLPEQRKIAEILRTWDEAIAKLEALRAAKCDRLTGLTQKLLGLGGAFPDRWKQRPLSAISTRVRRQNGGGDHPVMTISAKSGFRLQSDKFSRDMAGSSVDRYIVLHEGEFAYNKGNSLTAPYGCIFPLDRPTALVPFVYFCFALKADLNREFFAHLFAAGALNHQLSRLINSGVRNDGLLNLSPEDFFGCKVPVPPADEQSAIASALTTAKQEIGLLETEIEALTRQKRGLMQKLLTGEWRVSC